MNKEFIVEFGIEELPTNFLNYLNKNLESIVETNIKNIDIKFSNIEIYFTPRRILIFVKDLSDFQNDKILEKQGPPTKIFYNADNKTISKVGEKFLKSNNLTLDDIKKISTKKGDYIFISKKIKGKSTADILPDLIRDIVTSLHLPKSMVWNESLFEFIRPIRYICALYNGNKVEINIAGLSSVDYSIGHRFLSDEKIVIRSIDDFKKDLLNNFVMFDFADRKKNILNGINKILSAEGKDFYIKENNELIDINAGMVEYPFVQLCEFQKEFKNLPEDLIATSIIHHQKAFPVYNKEGITNYFIVVLNNEQNENTKKGNERVVNARLNDAKFFFEEDRKKGKLENFVSELEDILFLKSLGSMYDKVKRIKNISEYIAKKFGFTNVDNIVRTAELCKADLMTNVVYEFPELQGKAGSIYAELDGEDKEVALGIDEHYKPRNADDNLPQTITGKVVGLADKLDTTVGCFGIGLIPTGSSDPYQLRRFSLAIINELLENKLYLDIKDIIKFVIGVYSTKFESNEEDIINSIIEFIKNRFKTVLIEKGFASDEIDSILTTDFSDIYDSYLRVTALHKFRKFEEFKDLLIALKRMNNILKDIKEFQNFDNTKIKEAAEKDLFLHHKKNEKIFNDYYGKRDYEKCMEVLSGYKSVVDKFFDEVLVMDKEKVIRDNRLALLYMIVNSFKKLIEFSKIQNKEKS